MGYQFGHRAQLLAREFDLQLTAELTLNGHRGPLPRGRKLSYTVYGTTLFTVGNQGSRGTRTKAARHAQHMHRLEDAGFAAAIGAVKNIYLSQLAQRDLGQITEVVDL